MKINIAPFTFQTGLCYHWLWCSVAAYLWLTVQRSMLASANDAFGEVWALSQTALLPSTHHRIVAWELEVSIQSTYTVCSSWTFNGSASVCWFSILNVQKASRLQDLIPHSWSSCHIYLTWRRARKFFPSVDTSSMPYPAVTPNNRTVR